MDARFNELTFTLYVEGPDTIGEVKAHIRHKKRIPIANMWLSHAGNELEDERTLSSYDIAEGLMQAGATLTLRLVL